MLNPWYLQNKFWFSAVAQRKAIFKFKKLSEFETEFEIIDKTGPPQQKKMTIKARG
jgi:hypothetical protein